MSYWEECVSEAFEDAGITANPDQIATVAYWVEGAHENYGMAHGHDAIPNPQSLEVERLERELQRERNKTICHDCRGRGRIVIRGPVHSADSECSRCRGEGMVTP